MTFGIVGNDPLGKSINVDGNPVNTESPLPIGNYRDYFHEVVIGNVPGRSNFIVGAENPNVEPGAEETIWSQGGRINFLTSNTNLYISSTDASDNQFCVVNLLNDNNEIISGSVTLNGQNQVLIDQQGYRVGGVFVLDETNSNAGDLYIAESDTLTDGVPNTLSKIQLKVPAGFNGNSNATWTVRKDKIGYITKLEGTVGKSKDVSIFIRLYIPGGFEPFKLFPLRVFQSTFTFFNIGFEIGEGTTIEVTAETNDVSSPVTVKFNILEVDIS